MLDILKEKLEYIQSRKDYEVDQLKRNNTNIKIDNITNQFKLDIRNDSWKNQENVSVEIKENGIQIVSSLDSSEHRYLYYNNKDEKGKILNFIRKKDFGVEISFPGYSISDNSAEVHLICKNRQEGSRFVKKCLIGGTIYIDKEEIINNNINDVEIGFRVKGTVDSYIHNPTVYGNDFKQKKLLSENTEHISKSISNLNVIFIADEFTTRCFEPEFNLIKVTPENWKKEILKSNPDMFFCESAWLGNDGEWKNKVGTGGPRDNTRLLQLIKWCNSQGIPTIFWNKEDPFHFQAFIETAKHFDYVFTTDENSIIKYKQEGCENVYTLPFAAQPKIHNPIEKFERKNKVVFAGAYYGEKFPERKKAMDNMISISGKYGLDIYDRNYDQPESPNQFPEEFQQYIVGKLPPGKIDKAYKGYKVSLNVNSIVNSRTMFSRRVFEILAANTPLVSSESLGIEEMFGDLVVSSSDYNVLRDRIKKYFEDENFYKKNRLLTLRKVLEHHTYYDRIKKMLNDIEFDYKDESSTVSVIGIVSCKEDYEKLLEQYNRQTLKNKKLIILLDIFEGYLDIFNNNNTENVHTFSINYIHNYSSISEIVQTEFFAPFNVNHYYGENYLKDMFLSTLYTDETIIVKNMEGNYSFTTGGHIDRSLIPENSVKFLSPLVFVEMIKEQDTSMYKWFKTGVKFFSIDNYNFVNSDSLSEENILNCNI